MKCRYFRHVEGCWSMNKKLGTCPGLMCNACQRSISNENTKNKPPSFTFSKIPRTWSLYVKFTMNYNARAQLLFCSLHLLFCGVLVAIAVVVCLRSLLATTAATLTRMLPNKRFNAQNNGSKCARHLPNDNQVLEILESVICNGYFFAASVTIERCHCIFSLGNFFFWGRQAKTHTHIGKQRKPMN